MYIKVRLRPDAGWLDPRNASRIYEGTLIRREPSHLPGIEWLTVDDGKETVDIWLNQIYVRTERINLGFRSDIIEILELKE